MFDHFVGLASKGLKQVNLNTENREKKLKHSETSERYPGNAGKPLMLLKRPPF